MPAVYGFTSSLASQKPRGISQVFVKKSTGDTGYSSLGSLRNGKANIKSLASQNAYKRSQSFAAVAEYEFEMKQSSSVELKLMDSLIAGDVDVIIKCVDAQYYVHAADSTRLGIRFESVNDSKLDTNRFIKITMRVGLLTSELVTVMPSIAPTVTAPTVTDVFWGIANINTDITNLGRSNAILPAGVAKLEVCALVESSYVDCGEVTASSMNIKCFGTEVDKLRFRTAGLTITGSFDLMQDTNTEKAQLSLVHTNGMNVKVTHYDGLLWTLADKVGVQFDEKNEGDFDGHKFVNLKFDGNILVTSFDGIVS